MIKFRDILLENASEFNDKFIAAICRYKDFSDQTGKLPNFDKLIIPDKFKNVNQPIYRGLNIYNFDISKLSGIKQLESYTFDRDIAEDFARFGIGRYVDRFTNDRILLKINNISSSKVVLNFVDLFKDPEFVLAAKTWAAKNDIGEDFWNIDEGEVICRGIEINDISEIYLMKQTETEWKRIK